MEYRPLGRTGLAVSALSLGGAAFGQQYGPVTARQVADTVHHAIAAGINLIDTAAYYGRGLSEELLGQALQGGLRQHVYLCTKACRLDVDQFDFTPQGTRRCFEASLKRLGTDAVDILIAHDIEFAPDYDFVFNETANVLHQLKKEGKTRFVGMSGYPLPLLRQAMERCELDVVISYAHYTLYNTRLVTDLLPTAEARGVGVLSGSPLALGLLTDQGPQPWFPGPARLRECAAQAAQHCRLRGANIAQLGMQFALGEKRIASVITGAANPAELEMNLAAMTAPWDEALLAEVQAILAPVKDVTWPSGNWRD